jgi:hypothetical protein
MTNAELQPQPFILVQGQRVGLGALRHDLIPTYLFPDQVLVLPT